MLLEVLRLYLQGLKVFQQFLPLAALRLAQLVLAPAGQAPVVI
jgi:hypothetical protein